MRAFLALLPALFLAPSVHAQFIDTGTGALEYIVPASEEAAVIETGSEPAYDVEWFDVAKMIDQYRIPEKVADLRGITTDASGTNVGFYFASSQKGEYSVYRNGRRMARGTTESLVDLQEPAVFRMTASGDLIFAVRGTELYVNNKNVSSGLFQFTNATSVHEHGGLLTFPEGGSVQSYDIAKDRKMTLYKHPGAIQYLRRAGGTIAYTVFERGFTRMYRDGRRVSVRGVENPKNFAVSASGDVYFFTKAPRGYALFRNNRSMVMGNGAGAYVDIDPAGRAEEAVLLGEDRPTPVPQHERHDAPRIRCGEGHIGPARTAVAEERHEEGISGQHALPCPDELVEDRPAPGVGIEGGRHGDPLPHVHHRPGFGEDRLARVERHDHRLQVIADDLVVDFVRRHHLPPEVRADAPAP